MRGIDVEDMKVPVPVPFPFPFPFPCAYYPMPFRHQLPPLSFGSPLLWIDPTFDLQTYLEHLLY